ncbi:Amine oxidase [Klebsiella michiganensis]|nr:Amine oxidase [Klebsiella michiganensis]
MVLHSDPRWLPVRKRAWASWNYRLSEQDQASACVTYNMNILQGLPADAPLFCVTLNPQRRWTRASSGSVWSMNTRYLIPKAGPPRCGARKINGRQRSWFCGAYWYNGFHEDGVRSALDVVNGIIAAENL